MCHRETSQRKVHMMRFEEMQRLQIASDVQILHAAESTDMSVTPVGH